MPLKLFTPSELRMQLHRAGLLEDERWGLHVVTNVIPSTILHNSDPGKLTQRLFVCLASFEKLVNHVWPFNAFACSLLVSAHKPERKAVQEDV